MEAKNTVLGPWTTGMMNLVSPQSIPTTALVDAVNCDIDKDGVITSRRRFENIHTANASRLYELHGNVYGLLDGELVRFNESGFTTLATVTGDISWSSLNGKPIFCTYDGVFEVDGDNVSQLGIGNVRDWEAEKNLQLLPGGKAVASWQGRVLVANGSKLIFSQPLRFGAYNPFEDYIKFDKAIHGIAALDGGVYVLLDGSVRFLKGSSPKAMTHSIVGGETWSGACAIINTAGMDSNIVGNHPYVAVWFTPTGFAIGLPTGEVKHPQADRITGLQMQSGELVVLGDRLIVLSE